MLQWLPLAVAMTSKLLGVAPKALHKLAPVSLQTPVTIPCLGFGLQPYQAVYNSLPTLRCFWMPSVSGTPFLLLLHLPLVRLTLLTHED